LSQPSECSSEKGISLGSRWYLVGLLLVDSGLVALALVDISSDFSYPLFHDLFNLQKEETLPNWYATVKLALAGLLYLNISERRMGAKSTRKLTISVGMALILMSIDEATSIRYRIAHSSWSESTHIFTSSEIGIGIMLGVFAVSLLLFPSLKRLLRCNRTAGYTLIGGLFFLATGGYVMDALSHQFFQDRSAIFHHRGTVLEEYMEMIGSSLIIFSGMLSVSRRSQ
jgi:hypothetical protein